MSRYYAVVAGHCVGVYTDLDDALAMTRGYSHAKLKRFSTLGGARELLNSHGLEIDYTHNPRQWLAYPMNPDPKHPATLVAFCGGSAIRNGQPDCHAAYACIFPHCQGAEVVGAVPQPWATSNRAEYLAAWIALVGANMVDADGTKVLYIYTDSMMLINSMTLWIYKWQRNGWRTVRGTAVKNRDILERLVRAQGRRNVLWRHVKAHTGSKTWESHWNQVAYSKARSTAQQNAAKY